MKLKSFYCSKLAYTFSAGPHVRRNEYEYNALVVRCTLPDEPSTSVTMPVTTDATTATVKTTENTTAADDTAITPAAAATKPAAILHGGKGHNRCPSDHQCHHCHSDSDCDVHVASDATHLQTASRPRGLPATPPDTRTLEWCSRQAYRVGQKVSQKITTITLSNLNGFSQIFSAFERELR